MRIVVLCSSPYSETGCAMAARLAQLGHVPVGAVTLPAADKGTLIRKIGQWGLRASVRYAWAKLAPGRSGAQTRVRNPYLESALQHDGRVLRSLNDVASAFGFPVFTCSDQNSSPAIAQLRDWAPDLAVFTGGDILRKELLGVPRIGVINSHLALLPEIRGMSSPEWSLLTGVPLGITIHLMDSGIDTGPILLRREFALSPECDSLMDLRNRMIAAGIGMVGETVAGLAGGSIAPAPQSRTSADTQFFVMHDRLKSAATQRLQQVKPQLAEKANG